MQRKKIIHLTKNRTSKGPAFITFVKNKSFFPPTKLLSIHCSVGSVILVCEYCGRCALKRKSGQQEYKSLILYYNGVKLLSVQERTWIFGEHLTCAARLQQGIISYVLVFTKTTTTSFKTQIFFEDMIVVRNKFEVFYFPVRGQIILESP